MGDGDGINDTFASVFHVPWVTDHEFLILDRCSEMIFLSNTPGEGWKGNMRGSLVESEVCGWKHLCRDVLTKERIDRVGHIKVVR